MAFRRVTICLFLGIALLCGRAWGIDGPEVIRRQQQRYEGLKSLSARFKKQHYWKLVDQKTEIRGQLYVQKPDRFRFETDVQTVVTDGKAAWNYTPDNEQVLLSTYEKAKEDRSYEKLLFDLILLGGYEARFTPKYVGEERVDGKPCHVVALTARESESYIARTRLWVDKKLWLVRRVEYFNINEDITTYELSDIRVDRRLDEALFTFSPPEGVEVIDLR